VRARLQQPGGYWIFPKLAGYEEEKLLFHLAVASATQCLWVSHARADEDGKALTPSIYWRELCRAAGRDPDAGDLERLPRPPFAKWETQPPEFRSLKELSLTVQRNDQDPSLLWGSAGENLRRLHVDLTAFLKRDSPGPLEGRTGPLEAWSSRLASVGYSASALDTLEACPFRFWMRRGLRLDEPSTSSEEGGLSQRLRGRLFHAVLEDAYRAGIDGPFAEEKLLAAARAVFARWPWSALGVYPLIAEWDQERMREALLRFIREDRAECAAGGWRPQAFEAAVEAEAAWGFTDVRWRGRLDRLDVSIDGNARRVVDYKSSRRGGLSSKILKDQSFQPWLYMELAAAQEGPPVTGVVFKALEPGDKNFHEYSVDRWRAEREARAAAAGELIALVGRGDFVIRPDEGERGLCATCGFAAACRKAHGPTRRRALSFWKEEDA
jgi:ATP-dependent helicase/nuclease subunit B